MFIVCERWVGDGDRLPHIDPSFSDHSCTFFSSWLGLLNRRSLMTQTPLPSAGSQFGILSPTDSNWLKPSVSWLYFCLTFTCFRCSSAYLHRWISWLTARSRVNILHCFKCIRVVYWPSTWPNMPFQRQRKWYILMAVIGRNRVGGLGWQYWTRIKSHDTVIDWCTGREGPVNCRTVISAWWRSNMPFQGRRKWHIPMASHGEILSGRLNYYITRWGQEVS